ncbi:AMP-binding protein [Candidatus Rariloculus sp.]|uniref:AMP-binding protein n=1 Tax=Candidatus Rariloculus sp. TaxID=3101265 RepID=UPI003D0A0ACE
MADKPWLTSYAPGVPAEIDPDRFASLPDLLRDTLERFADRPAFSNRGTMLRFAEIDRLSRDFAAYLHAVLGLKRGDRVAVMLPNLLQSPIVLFGVLRAGLVVVNINPLYTARELQYQLNDSGTRTIVVLENFAATVAAVLGETGLDNVIVTRVGDQFPSLKRLAVNFAVKYVKRLVRRVAIAGSIDYRTALREGGRREFVEPALTGDDLAFLQYTGGTTGPAKGAMLTQRSVLSNVVQAQVWFEPHFDVREGAVFTALPLYHVFALTANLLAFARLGAHNVLITNPRDLTAFVAELKRYRCAFLTGVNTLFNALLNTPEFGRVDFSGLRICLAGGMAVQRDVAERWSAITGVPICQGYGLTEASPIVSSNPLDIGEFNGSVGVPLPSTEVSIVDDAGAALGAGEKGEIYVRGPQVMAGYWNRPEATAEVITADGWLRTGDIGHIDERGFIFIDDRKKDLIIVSGFNVYPNEVEDVATTHPGVLEAAAVGVGDEQSGEVVKLFVVRSDATLDAADLIEYCRQSLTGYKIPKHVAFVDELPKSTVGKILRRELRDRETP